MNKKTITSYGEPIEESKIFPALLSFKRNQLVAKNFLKLTNGLPTLTLEDLDIKTHTDGSVFVDELIVDEKTLDTYRRNIVRYPNNFRDVYESLDYNDNDINGLTGSYIRFEYEPTENGEGKFNEILYRYFIDERDMYLRKYTDDDLNLILKQTPNHPMIVMMKKVLDRFSSPEKYQLPTRETFEKKKDKLSISKSDLVEAQMQ